ncbi:hypothetical protein LCGC14_0441320 [marine sediment metagenome]|uniref:Uncharacterized protein n=1 Tax=marine sediment metagenome TaxID=412755 RepID=A0A0F9SKA0_9ZZZZ
MARFNFLQYTISVEKKTGAIVKVQTELKGVEQAGKRVEQGAKKMESAFGGIGSTLKTIGIAAFLFSAVKQATAASDSLNELNSAWKEGVGTIINEFEPALALMSRGLQGVILLITGLVKVISTGFKGALEVITKLLARDFTGALKAAETTVEVGFENILDTIQAAGDRAAQITRVSEQVQSKIILEEGKIRLGNLSLTGEERLALVDDIEKRALAVLRASGEFLIADKTRQAKLEIEILKELATEREAAQREIITNDTILAQTQAEIRQVAIDDEATSAEERQELLVEQLALRIEAIQQAAQVQSLTEETVNAKIELATLKHIKTLKKLKDDQFKGDVAATKNDLNLKLKALKTTTGLDAQRIAGISSAASAELQIAGNAANAARAGGAQAVKDAGAFAARIISIKGAEATARAFAAAGGFPLGIPAAIATAAVYAGLAATVSAISGAVAAKIAPPSGGGAAGPAGPGGGAFGFPTPVEVVEPVGGGGGFTPSEAAVVPGAAPGFGREDGGGPVAIVQVFTVAGKIPPETAKLIAQALRDNQR